MKKATSLTLIAIGAILTFAVTSSPSFLNLQIAGVVIMATGVAGLFLPKPSQGWLRRRTVLRRGARGPVVGGVDEQRYPPYVMLNPGADPGQGNGHQPGDLTMADTVEPEERDGTAPIPSLPAEDLPAEDVAAEDLAAEPVDPDQPAAAEVVEEYIQE
jgi:hypothetical protein